MKRIFFFFCFVSLTSFVRAQDAATTERLNKLEGYIQDLQEDKAAAKKQMAEMAKEIQSMREQLAKPSGNYASAEDLHKLAETVREVDKKRVEDNQRVAKQLDDLGKVVAGGGGRKPKPVVPDKPADTGSSSAAIPDKGFEYQIQSGDTLGAIVQAYKEKGMKITVDQIVKANPGLNPNAMRVGQKIFIPAPQ